MSDSRPGARGHYALGHPVIGPRPLARTRSFTRRGGRMPHTHQQAWDRHAGEVLLEVPRSLGERSTAVDPSYRLDVGEAFGRRAPLVVEIGSGAGDALASGATARPDWDFLAFEVWRPGIGHALLKLEQAGGGAVPPNVRILEADAALALRTVLEPGGAHEVWTFFPDPWPKARHHKRRIVTPEFADTVVRLLAPGGTWRLATDWDDYAESMQEVLDAHAGLRLVSTERAPLRPVTRFERRGVEAGRAITDLAYVRI
ncbi:tRNA (guanosine(46)-N7)-methyltransferase TrmB [Ornithinimicrobium tianjinense]|uniref:tRNA (guanine-N(7)-)-methyltransferase n=1 Tax=Ornithinimicrobium tianjinense TaxID=1195761 RepID=A0A917F5T1_9MICO|nr:tRNA (guanosine(46)-N7)-methyltransferase TrmB [Ornithinimicrobium tianjinense]GGF49559.1 tRNA (guanine-N(7)-)-methyltransferase [Ornithinimicrobium tianjinense]